MKYMTYKGDMEDALDSKGMEERGEGTFEQDAPSRSYPMLFGESKKRPRDPMRTRYEFYLE